MINWCPNCNTSISDAEVEFEEEPTHLWYIRYKVKDEDRYVIVATTRPETMLGDTGVAVHPSDERYKDLIGKKIVCVTNLKPVKLRGELSEGMILAGSTESGIKVIFVDERLQNGSKVK